jgi:hypothetical protein
MAEEITTLTVTVKGEGGAIFEMDIPPAGTFRRENFDEFLAKGWLTIIEGDYTPPVVVEAIAAAVVEAGLVDEEVAPVAKPKAAPKGE